jgi:hypothetical protein
VELLEEKFKLDIGPESSTFLTAVSIASNLPNTIKGFTI